MLDDKYKNIDISVTIPAYNAKDTIYKTLEALVNQDTDLPYEVVVVESSGDGTGRIVEKHFPNVRLIESKSRMNGAAARNLGAKNARGKLLAFVDADCVVESSWASRMWQAHQEWDCAVVAGSILNGNPESLASISCYMNEFSDFFPYGKPRYCDYLPSGNISYKAEVFRKYGGFDGGAYIYEDLIFNKKLSRAGEKLLFDPRIRSAHYHRTELKNYLLHELKRGKAAANARRLGLLIGSSWVKHPLLAFSITPGLFLRKASVFPYRFARCYPLQVGRMVCTLPVLYLGLVVWHWGFLSDVVANYRKTDKE